MESNQIQQPHHHPPQPTTKLFKFKFKPKPYYFISIFALFLAISLTFIPQSSFYKSQHLKLYLSPHFRSISTFFNSIPNPNQELPSNSKSEPAYCVLWMAPFFSGGGYSSEAWSYILAIHDYMIKNPLFKLSIEQHGDEFNLEFWEGLPSKMKKLAYELYQKECRAEEMVAICHSEPGAWNPQLFETLPCPPDAKFAIGRTMFETDRVNPEHVRRCNKMDSVWVPTEFHVLTFIGSGVDPSKVVKVVQPVDSKFFDPRKYAPLDIASVGSLVLGSGLLRKQFVFLSIFKWEYRKGWDVLLKAYLKEFSKDDGVALYLLTNPYHTGGDFGNKIVEFVEGSELERPAAGWAPIYVIDTHIPQTELPSLYKAADAFVLPSRGEGWGRPIVESMAMSLPVIATNWSGPTEYLTDENSYLLPVDRMSEVMEGPFKGHSWAEPSIDKLRILMRHVMSNREEALAKGKQARNDMITRFSPEIVARIVTDHIQQQILDKLD